MKMEWKEIIAYRVEDLATKAPTIYSYYRLKQLV